MAGIQRFVTYIYAYEDGEKAGNAGYAKIETRGSRGQIDIHFLDGGIYRGKGKLAFLFTERGRLMYIPLGEFEIENGVGTGSVSFRTDVVVGTDVGFAKIDGIYIIDSENRKYLSFWRDVNIADFSEANFVEYGMDEPMPEPENQLEVKQTEPNVAVKKEWMEEAEQESLHTMEIPMRNIFPTYTLDDIWKNFTKTKTPVQINGEVSAIQIELSDLRELPKNYWYLGNNSFLLHGFFNYHHVLFGKLPDGKWFLGVPGVYARQERVMASVFGFPGFMHIGEEEQITPREKQQGVWYHILEE